MAPPSAAPQWVALSRWPRPSMELPKGHKIALALDEPPRPSELLVPPLLGVRGSVVLAADPSGILLLSCVSSCGTDDPLAAAEPASASYHLCDAIFKVSFHVPVLERLVEDEDTGVFVAGLVNIDHRIMVAELSIRDSAATLRCFSKETSMWTTHENLLAPPMIKHQWCSSYALSYRGRLWWVDLLQGLVACDSFADNPELHFVPLPSCHRRHRGIRPCREGLSKDRCVSLSCEKLRLVVIDRSVSQTRIKLWTLADYEAGKWFLDFDVHIRGIWDHQSYRITGLPMETPEPVFVHPTNAHVVYFFLQQQLFAVDLQTAKVAEFSEFSGRDDGEHFLAWELPSSLRISGPSPTQMPNSFDNVADFFCGAYGLALADMEFQQLSGMALAYLNGNKKPEDNMYKFSERLFLQTFVEDNNTRMKKYAHLNFYADTGSKKILVFAEFRSDAVCDNDLVDDWTLSSCKTLTRNWHGGLYGENADERRRKGAKKRKRSTYCFACAPEILHPISGFEGGYPGVSPI